MHPSLILVWKASWRNDSPGILGKKKFMYKNVNSNFYIVIIESFLFLIVQNTTEVIYSPKFFVRVLH